jgi:hypothetical protein
VGSRKRHRVPETFARLPGRRDVGEHTASAWQTIKASSRYRQVTARYPYVRLQVLWWWLENLRTNPGFRLG